MTGFDRLEKNEPSCLTRRVSKSPENPGFQGRPAPVAGGKHPEKQGINRPESRKNRDETEKKRGDCRSRPKSHHDPRSGPTNGGHSSHARFPPFPTVD